MLLLFTGYLFNYKLQKGFQMYLLSKNNDLIKDRTLMKFMEGKEVVDSKY